MIHRLRPILRHLVRRPLFTVVTVLTLALAIGANSAIFSVVHGVLLEPLPFPEPGRLVAVQHTAPGLDLEEMESSQALFVTYRELSRSLQEVGLVREEVLNLTGVDRPERLPAAEITPSLFPVLGVRPALGPGFGDDDVLESSQRAVVISHRLWRDRLGRDPNVLERTLRLDGVERRVAGVMPPGFGFPEPDTDIWFPLIYDPAAPDDGDFNWAAVARLAPGADPATAQRELESLLPRMVELYAENLTLELLERARLAPVVVPLKDEVVGDVGGVLWVLLGTVAVILLIACANVANLFLSRAEGRQREMAVRTALGAGRGELARIFLAESVVLALAGGVAGLGLAFAGVRALVAFGPESIPRLHEVGIDPPVLAFTAAVSLLAGLLFGSVPLLRFARGFRLTAALKEGGRGSSAGRERHLARNGLVVAQVALALVLLTSSGLMVRSFWELSTVDPGFDPQGVLTLRVSLDETDYPQGGDVADFFLRLEERLRALPGVAAAGAGSGVPLGGQRSASAHSVEERPVPPDGLPPILANIRVTPGYFEALGIPVQTGRSLRPADLRQARGSALVTRALAERFWPGESALGQRLQFGMPEDAELDKGWYEVVGVVGDLRFDGLREEPVEMVFYPNGEGKVPERWWFSRTLTLAVRAEPGVEPLSLAAPVREAVWSLDPNLPVADVRTARDIVDDSMSRTAFTTALLLLAAAVALVLGTVGLYGVISYIVSLRTREMGVRMALGAAARDVSGMVVGQGLAVAAAGVVVGLLGAVALTRVMTALLFGVSATDPATFAAVSTALLAVAALASWLPARRAATVDPLEALRHE